MNSRGIVIFFVIFFFSARLSFATWTQVAPTTFHAPIGCGFFFDEENGFIGEGTNNSLVPAPKIFRTSDGGNSWTICITPASSQGHITSIFMKNALIGYASISSTDNSFLWKTTDGGNSWFDLPQTNSDGGTCVYATSKALIETSWNSGLRTAAGVSFDDGITFNRVFAGGTRYWSNGIDFSDDNNGIVVMGPSNANGGLGCWLTHDGGQTWALGAPLKEAWAVYAVKGKNLFFALPEGSTSNRNGTVYRTTNTGVSWQAINSPNAGVVDFTGHIAGADSVLYIQTATTFSQTDRGLYRSTDLGTTWKNVNGPSNERDTRFVVTGCGGEVVYAFDNRGGVWKTTDGGNGEVRPIKNGPILSLVFDSIFTKTRFCQPIMVSFPLENINCSPLVIDSVQLSDTSGAFALFHSPSFIPKYSTDSILIQFRSTINERRKLTIRVKGSEGGRVFDTILTLDALHSRSPELAIDSIPPTKVGDTVEIQFRILPPTDSINIQHIAFHLSYDADLLNPLSTPYVTTGTLSENYKTIVITPTAPGELSCVIDLKDTITDKSDFSKPVLLMKFRVMLTKSLSCQVRIDSFGIVGKIPLPTCKILLFTSSIFNVAIQCGDSLLSSYMLTGNIPKFNSIIPNPAHDHITINYDLGGRSNAKIQIITVLGRVLDEHDINNNSSASTITTEKLPSGNYYLRMETPDGIAATRRISIQR